MRAGVRVVLLDAMGTLLWLRPPGPALARALDEQHGLAVSADGAAAALRAEIAYYRVHHDEGRDEASLHDLRLRCARVLGQALGGAAAALAPEALVGTLLDALRFCAFEDAAPALGALRAQGRRVVVVSNWDVSLPEVLERIGLASLLDDVVTSAAVGAAKPRPEIFAAALGRIGATSDQALHVGDSVEHDVRGAHAAGIEAVLIARGSAPVAARGDVAVIGSLSELAGLAA